MLTFDEIVVLHNLRDEYMKNKPVKYTKEQIAEFKSFEYMDQNLWTGDDSFIYFTRKVGCDILGWNFKTKRGKIDTNTKTKLDQLRVLLLNLKTVKSSFVSVSMRKDFYDKRPARYRSKITKVIIPIVKELASAGLIELYMGTKNIKTGFSFPTKLRPTTGLLEMLNNVSLSKIIDTTEEVIILKDSASGGMRTGEDGKYEFHKKTGNIIDYIDTKETKRMRAEIKAYNKFLSKHDITLPDSEPLVKTVYRVFNDSSFEHGGRFVGGFWQNCKKELRPGITIDNQSTVEIDFTGSHYLIMYAFQGLPLPLDPYDNIEGTDREQAKKISQLLLGCKTRAAVINGIKEGGILEEAVDAFLTRHEPISSWFLQKMATRLQRIEARIISTLHKMAIKADIPVLTIHDSAICKAEDKEKVMAMMAEAFKEVLNTTDNPPMKVKG